MSLLTLEHVSKHYKRGLRERTALHDVSLEVDHGELVAVWGLRGSGRSTLLRIAAGVEAPDSGSVRFAGCDLADRGGDALGGGIAYCQKAFRPADGQFVLERMMMGQLARGVSSSTAKTQARSALERAGVGQCASMRSSELDSTEAARVAIARALALQPRLLVVDEPTKGVELRERDEILLLLRSLADDGTAVLTSTSEGSGLSGADRALSLSEGVLSGMLTPQLASVTPLRRAATGE